MIGTNLPAGTELICLDAAPRHVPVPLVQGGLYTLRGYTCGPTGYCAVLLMEVQAPQIYRVMLGLDGEDGFFRDRFRVLNIHKSLTDMLTEANQKQKSIAHAHRKEEIVFYPDGSIEVKGTLFWE
jgi:hypothetical protein